MQLSQFTDFGLRTLLYLGLNTGRVVTLQEVADGYAISLNHLRKVSLELHRKGYVEVSRGPGGGFQLARAPRDIRLGQVVRDLEPNLALVACFPGHSAHCVITPVCQLKPILYEALAAFIGILDRYTLEDCLKRPQLLLTRFPEPGPPNGGSTA